MNHLNIALPAFKSIALVTSVLLLGQTQAQAHHVWIEQDGNQATLYFGEFADNLREVSPGRLDNFGKPTAQKVSGKGTEALITAKTSNGFALSAVAAKGESLVAEDAAYPIADRKDGDKTLRSLYVPAARLITDNGRQDARLTLDLVPTGKQNADGMEVQAIYKGKPLPKAKVELIAASGWGKTLKADEEGKLTLKMPWKGSYVLELKHADGPGERAGEKYDRASFVTSLTVVQADGVAPMAAPPSAPPAAPLGKTN